MGDTDEVQTENQNHGGGNPPTFSGRMRDYEDWKYDAGNWKFNTKVTKEKIASRLYGAQTVASVKSVMKGVPVSMLQSDKGWDEIMKQMDKKFMPKKETTAWTAFDELEDQPAARGRGRSTPPACGTCRKCSDPERGLNFGRTAETF